ncbi:MAG: arsenic efflux protein [Lentisphaeria bacterium]|nr:arsenic efflux protein [Candidatus Neomarinimicrobiota bacterium]MCF7841649.1 arsenic efflux protein [Lentisphaeria bacterium]
MNLQENLKFVGGIFEHSIAITFFVFVMMVIVEAVHVLSRGRWEAYFCARGGIHQYIWAILLGALPGCLGGFAAVTLFQHRLFSLGALVATMIATSGDETFVMLALFPKMTLFLTGVLMVVAFVAGYLTDRVFHTAPAVTDASGCDKLEIHPKAEIPPFRPWALIRAEWRQPDWLRLLTILTLFILLVLFAFGILGPAVWNWKRITFLGLGGFTLLVLIFFPGHFVQTHIVQHIVREHVLRIFLWTFGALLLVQVSLKYLDLDSLLNANPTLLILSAGLIGIIPESGPHLVFVTLFSKNVIGFVPLLVSSIVQDGHAMLPLLAFSRKRFLQIKGINLLVGLIIGGLWLVF